MYKIYKITNKKRPSELYVGSSKLTLKERYSKHASSKRSSVYPYIQKYGKENFEITVIDYASTKEEALKKEEFWTIFLKKQGYFLYNKQVGNKLTEEHIKKISERNTGRHVTEKTRRKMSEAQKGKHLSDEAKRKLSEANKGKNNPMYGKDNHRSKQVRCIENNKIYESCTAAAKDLNCSIGNIVSVCKGKLKYTKGFHFEYI